MHRILEIAIGVGLGMTIFLVILWLLGTVVYICCGKTKKIASVRKLKNFTGKKENQEPETTSEPEISIDSKSENKVSLDLETKNDTT